MQVFCFLEGGAPIMSIFREIESRLEEAWSNELRRTIYELILILTPLAILLLAIR
jgi:hypothetical protein